MKMKLHYLQNTRVSILLFFFLDNLLGLLLADVLIRLSVLGGVGLGVLWDKEAVTVVAVATLLIAQEEVVSDGVVWVTPAPTILQHNHTLT